MEQTFVRFIAEIHLNMQNKFQCFSSFSYLGLTRYLNAGFNIDIPPDQFRYCAAMMTVVCVTTECSTWFILSMTFERCYSIIRPHKAASFNTVKKAKITIVCIVIICTLYSSPHAFMTTNIGTDCVPFGKGDRIYFWLDQVVGFVFPFVSLLIMNSFIIHALRKRSKSLLASQKQDSSQEFNDGQSSKMTTSEKQIIIMLLFVTFGFLILMTPSYGVLLYVTFVDFTKSPKLYVQYLLFFSIGEKTFYTNFGINFYLYVISGHKFRSDLVQLFKQVHSGDKSSSVLPSISTTE